MTKVFASTWAAVLCILLLPGCEFLDKPLPPCGLRCGPCDLGSWSCETDSCDLGELTDELSESGCDSVAFVSPGDTPGTGSQASPFNTISDALISGRPVVLVSAGRFEEALTIDNQQVYIRGGYNSDFFSRAGITALFSKSESAVTMNSATATLVSLDFLNDAQDSVSVGVSAFDSNIKLDDTSFQLQTTVEGVNSAGPPGANGLDGSTGEGGSGGRAGTNSSCPDADGGDGGRAGSNDNGIVTPRPGEPGASGAAGGRINERGLNGDDGLSGANGMDATVVFGSEGLTVTDPSTGLNGEHGHGGGGGGGSEPEAGNTMGIPGGGGGAGGCGGGGGSAGVNGSLHLGFLLVRSTLVATNSSFGSVMPSESVPPGLGGDGGPGGVSEGNGGAGGRGGDGGNGGVGVDAFSGIGFCHESDVDLGSVEADSFQESGYEYACE